METSLKLQALRACLAPAETRPKLAEIMSVVLADGTKWAVGTNGHIALAFPMDDELEAAATQHLFVHSDILVGVLSEFGETPHAAETHALRDWALALPGLVPEHFARGEILPPHCGECDASRMVACEECDGTGERDEQHHGCIACEDGGLVECRRCHPAESETQGQVRRGWLGGVMVNRTLLFRVLRLLPAGPCRLRLGHNCEPIRIDGNSWRAVVMPIRQTADWEKAEREAPVFEPLRTEESAHGLGWVP